MAAKPKTKAKANAGGNFKAQGRENIWFSADRPYEERQQGKRLGVIIKDVRTFFENNMTVSDKATMKRYVDVDNTRGTIYICTEALPGGKLVEAVARQGDGTLEIQTTAPTWTGLKLGESVAKANAE